MKKKLTIELFKIGAIKFGEYKLKSGIISPFYLDLRTIISFPKIFNLISELLSEETKRLNPKLLIGIPLGGIPLVTGISLKTEIPFIFPRDRVKDHGTQKRIEGIYKRGQVGVIIDDVITAGTSILANLDILENEGLKIYTVVTIIDREQGGESFLKEKGISLLSLLKMSEIINILRSEKLIDENCYLLTLNYLNKYRINK